MPNILLGHFHVFQMLSVAPENAAVEANEIFTFVGFDLWELFCLHLFDRNVSSSGHGKLLIIALDLLSHPLRQFISVYFNTRCKIIDNSFERHSRVPDLFERFCYQSAKFCAVQLEHFCLLFQHFGKLHDLRDDCFLSFYINYIENYLSLINPWRQNFAI